MSKKGKEKEKIAVPRRSRFWEAVLVTNPAIPEQEYGFVGQFQLSAEAEGFGPLLHEAARYQAFHAAMAAGSPQPAPSASAQRVTTPSTSHISAAASLSGVSPIPTTAGTPVPSASTSHISAAASLSGVSPIPTTAGTPVSAPKAPAAGTPSASPYKIIPGGLRTKLVALDAYESLAKLLVGKPVNLAALTADLEYLGLSDRTEESTVREVRKLAQIREEAKSLIEQSPSSMTPPKAAQLAADLRYLSASRSFGGASDIGDYAHTHLSELMKSLSLRSPPLLAPTAGSESVATPYKPPGERVVYAKPPSDADEQSDSSDSD
jgi:hypothetical protein